jgi:hypothetical protein
VSRAVVTIEWSHVPHLDAAQKQSILASIPPFQRDARTKGKPYLGAGQIYQIHEEELLEKPFQIPKHWLKGYGLDVGWNRTAAPFMAYDPETTVWHLYDEYYRAEAEPVVHVEGIKARGAWMEGEIDPASNGRNQVDGQRLLDMYTKLGLKLHAADNAVETGIYEVWSLMSTGRFKVFETCQHWRREFSMYRRNEKGQVVKENDHLMDGTRYRIVGGLRSMKQTPVVDLFGGGTRYRDTGGTETSWMA